MRNELPTSRKLPIKILILNNDGFGIIKQFQDLYLGGRYEAAGKGVTNPDFKKVSAAFNINYNVIKNQKRLLIKDKRYRVETHCLDTQLKS